MSPGVLVIALLLTGKPVLHGAAELGVGPSMPFQTVGSSFQLAVRMAVELELSQRFAVGVAVPVSLALFTDRRYAVAVGYQVVDLLPSLRGRVAVLDWLLIAVEAGLGPSVVTVDTEVAIWGHQRDTHPYFTGRGALEIEAAPESLSGLSFFIEPVAVHARVGTFSEYRFTLGVGYRR